ncbi:nmrA-like family protein [Sporothrix schenckii 1099-18]|uniref:NmrA-like family protein n=1 Tax=Sporothrix schenckii 1099-18 TaxID=1397361 RepID=A0A0F2LYN2_SPOSC|nr:nmrA-like family protein [Sporothrix schenckii 1099-18]KJR81939.1 nmrA-like family protein [Sporothrix schenckii 1099-18]
MSIKNVAVAGSKGALGVPIITELVNSGFTVTVLTREGSTATPPAGVAAVKPVDYKSVESLSKAIAGQDTIVSVLGARVISEQVPLVEAAAAPESTVRRFIPSEFGLNTRQTRGQPIGVILDGYNKIADLVKEKSKVKPSLTWTSISTGLFFDWGLERGVYSIDVDKRTATIYDSGNERFQATNLPFVAKAVAATLKQAGGNPADDKTANQHLEIASFTPTQNELLAAVQELTTGGADGWTITRVDSVAAQKTGAEKLRNGDLSAMIDLLGVWQFADGAGHAPDTNSPTFGNTVLGLPLEDFKVALAAHFKK